MKKIILFAVMVLCCTTNTYAQGATVNWGEEFKLKKGSTDLEVVYVDKTGVFVKESHQALKSYFVIGATTRESATLIKLDKSLTEEYRQDFNKELKGKDYERFFFLKDKLYLLATGYNKKEKLLTLYSAEIDKASGELAGDFVEVTSWQKEEKGDDIRLNVTYNSDSSRLVTVSTIEGTERNNYEVRQFDQKFKQVGKPIAITNEFDPKTFQLEDVLYTSTGNVVMVGRIYEYEEGKKKKAKFLQFRNYNVRVHGPDGSMLKEINTDISGKWLISTKVIQVPGKDIVLAAFYSNEKKGREINGMLIQRINPNTGDVIGTSEKEINTALITTMEDDDDEDDDDESKQERRERKKLEKIQDEEDGFSRHMKFRNFIYAPDGGLVILAEEFYTYTYTVTNMNSSANGGMRTTRTTYRVFECGDLMMSRMALDGKIEWLHVLPKEQKEIIQLSNNTTHGTGISFNMGSSFFGAAFNWPFYAGFGVLSNENGIAIIFNDHGKNDKVLQLGQKVKRISYFRKSDCYGVRLDPITGNYKRSLLFSNRDVPTAMPRLGVSMGKEFYLIGKEDRIFGKTKIAVGKVVLKK